MRFELLICLRRVGLAPWLLATCVAVIAYAQEPYMLRSFGVQIGPQAVWLAGSILLALLIAAKRNHEPVGISPSVVANLLLVLFVAGLVMATALVAEASRFRGVPAVPVAPIGLYFVMGWTPLALAAAIPQSQASLPDYFWMTAGLVLGIGMAPTLWSEGFSKEPSLAVGLACTGSTLGLIARRK